MPGSGKTTQIKLVSVAEMIAVEKAADAAGLTYARMMENAGAGLAGVIQEQFGFLAEDGILGLVGSGNNGGDALVALAVLLEEGWKATAYIVRSRPPGDPLVERFLQAGGVIHFCEQDARYSTLTEILGAHGLLLDGVLGTGIQLPLKGKVADVLDFVRKWLESAPDPPYIVAVDCPSGVDCDQGLAAPETLPADLTVTMAAVKQGLLSLPAYGLTGGLELVSIGLDEELPAWEAIRREVFNARQVGGWLPERPLDAHKGTFGTALICAGSLNYTGAVFLAGRAAYLAGAGLVTLAVPAPLHPALAGFLPEATWLLLPHEMGVISRQAARVVRDELEKATALLIGPGFGLEETTRDFLELLLGGKQLSGEKRPLGFVQNNMAGEGKRGLQELPPLVLDADGLKLVSQLPDWPSRLPEETILTPHPGEMAVLTGLSTRSIQGNRIMLASEFAAKWRAVVVLKGAFTVVAAPDGRTGVVPVATPALARAGTGDVLAGLITGLRAQGVPAYEAAAAGAWIHAQAGLVAEHTLGSTAGVLAGDLLAAIRDYMAELGN